MDFVFKVDFHSLQKLLAFRLNNTSSVLVVAREESAPQETWSREVSVIDMLQGSDGHVYKGRYKQVKIRYKQVKTR